MVLVLGQPQRLAGEARRHLNWPPQKSVHKGGFFVQAEFR